MSYGYGANPYDQRDGPATQNYGPAGSQYNRNQYNNAPAMGRDDYYGGQNVESIPLTSYNAQYGAGQDSILDEVRDINRDIAAIEGELNDLKRLQAVAINSTDSNANFAAKDKSAKFLESYRRLIRKVKAMKQKPESLKYPQQISNVEGKLESIKSRYQVIDNDFIQKLEEQSSRQYRLVRPDASDEEVRQAVQSDNPQIFQQALMQSNRQGQARSALNAVQSRHEEIKKIEQQMIEVAELFQEMQNMVVQQEESVAQIEMKAEETVEHMDKGNEQIGTAIKSARNARKWKWWCLGISVLIIVIIVIVILIYKFVIQNNSTTVVNKTGTKRWVLPSSISERMVLPGVEWKGERSVVSEKSWIPERRALAFKA